jgi:hypothetical protein
MPATERMERTREQSGSPTAEVQSTIYCVVPPELSELREPLESYFSGGSPVEVVLERRRCERRRGKDRRTGPARGAAGVDRRFAGGLEGRRFGQRRAILVPVEEKPALPPDLYGYLDQLRFVRRVERSGLHVDVTRLRETAAVWRDRCREAEREATGLLRTLVGVADDLGRVRSWSPRRFLAVHRAQRAIDRYQRNHSNGAHAPGLDGGGPPGNAEARAPSPSTDRRCPAR